MNMMKMMGMISCREASRLMSEKLDRSLRASERFSLSFHLIMCKGCSMISRQITALRSLFQAYLRTQSRPTSAKLSTDQKEKIKQRITLHEGS